MLVKRQDVIAILDNRIQRSKNYIRAFENQIEKGKNDNNALHEAIEEEDFIILMMENIKHEIKNLKGTE